MDETKIDAAMMGRITGALAFICGAEHEATKALRLAAETKTEKDVKAARTQFLKLKSSERRAALTMAKDD